MEQGGIYLSVCAGAYFACTSIEYHGQNSASPHPGEPGCPSISGPRPLGFFPGAAGGALELPGVEQFGSDPLSTASMTTLAIQSDESSKPLCPCLYWGGPMLQPDSSKGIHVIARYEDLNGSPIAICSVDVGKGRAILSGVHFEISTHDLEHARCDWSPETQIKAVKLITALKSSEEARDQLVKRLLRPVFETDRSNQSEAQ